MSTTNTPQTKEQIYEISQKWVDLKQEIQKKIVGQDEIIEKILVGVLCGGHVLLEGVPGLAKTTLITSLSQAIGLDFSRVQFTPDLLPADLIGTMIYSPKTEEFNTKKGPVFANIVLADEINRAPAKVQSALLEAMQEQQVTIGEETFELPNPFFVLATQNPIDQEGTYQLPEAQIDRFMLKLLIEYPTIEQEKQIITKVFSPEKIKRIISKKEIKEAQSLVESVHMDEKLVDYILAVVFATRNPADYGLGALSNLIMHGTSPRATLKLYHAAKAHAFLQRRHFVIPDDIKAVAPDILRHRILLSYHAEAEMVTADQIVDSILTTVPSP